MSERNVAAWTPTKRELIYRKCANAKWATYMFLHKVFWRTLHLTKLAHLYSVTACKYNFYSKYADGRCQWCGVKK